MAAQVAVLQELGPNKKAMREYGQKWEWGENDKTELLHLFSGSGYYIKPTLRNSWGSGPCHAR